MRTKSISAQNFNGRGSNDKMQPSAVRLLIRGSLPVVLPSVVVFHRLQLAEYSYGKWPERHVWHGLCAEVEPKRA